jgi:hypothetical protein
MSVRTQLEFFNWELFDHSQSDYHNPFTYLKNSLRSQRLNNDELEGVKKLLSSQATDSFDMGT